MHPGLAALDRRRGEQVWFMARSAVVVQESLPAPGRMASSSNDGGAVEAMLGLSQLVSGAGGPADEEEEEEEAGASGGVVVKSGVQDIVRRRPA